MPLKARLQAVLTCFVAATALGACAQMAPQAPGELMPDELRGFQVGGTPENLDGPSLIRRGYALADIQCDQFFIKLQTARNKNEYEAAQISAIATFVTPGMALLDAGAKAAGIAGGVFGFGTTTALNYSKYLLLTEYGGELQDLVHSARAAYITKLEGDTKINSTMSMYDAYRVVAGYVWYCTSPGIDSLTRAALTSGAQATAQVQKKTESDQEGAAAPPPPENLPVPRRRQVAPVVPPGLQGAGQQGTGQTVIVPQITVVR